MTLEVKNDSAGAPAQAPAAAAPAPASSTPETAAPAPAPQTAEPSETAAQEQAPQEDAGADQEETKDSGSDAAAEEPASGANSAPAPAPEPAPTPAPQAPASPPISPAATGTVSTDSAAAVGDTIKADVAKITTDFVDAVDEARAKAREVELGIENFDAEAKAFILNIIDTGSNEAKGIVLHLLDYVKKMGPNAPVSQQDIINHQGRLYSELTTALNHAGTHLHSMLAAILMIFHHHKDTGALSAALAFRGAETKAMPKDRRNDFHALLGMLRTLASVSTRKDALRQVDLQRGTAALSPEAAQRVKNFFKM